MQIETLADRREYRVQRDRRRSNVLLKLSLLMFTVIVLIILFLAASGIMAAVDAALLSVTEPEIQELVDKGRRGAHQLQTVRQRMTRTVIVVASMANLINVVGPIIVSQEAVSVFGVEALGLVTITLTLGTIVCSEIIPKSLGNRYATVIGRYAAAPIRWLQLLLFPLVVLLEWFSDFFTRGTRRIGTEEQIRSLTTLGRRAGYIEQDEGHLIHRVFVLNDRTAADIMTPLDQVVSLPTDMNISDAVTELRQIPFSRLPVFGSSVDDVQGIVLVRDILEAALHKPDVNTVGEIAMPDVVVDGNTPSDELLPEFLKRQIHLAVVQREGRTIGVVSLEDVLEQLVGDIKDERDTNVADE